MFRVETNISTRRTVAETMEEHGVDYTIRIPENKSLELGRLQCTEDRAPPHC